jgi:5'-nucleotidase/UDP-sugar diphosphatase
MRKIGKALMLALIVLSLNASSVWANFTLTVLHNNDGESKLSTLGTSQPNYGGAARFVTKVNELKTWGNTNTDGVVTLSSGDNFLAGAQYQAGVANGVYYDALVLDKIGYSALAFGNHDFDFGCNTLADFMNDYPGPNFPPYVICNMDFNAEPAIQAHVNNGRVVPSTILNVNGTLVGVVGAIYPDLASISSPGQAVVDPNLAAAIQVQVDAMTLNGAQIIILISHLQDTGNEEALVTMLNGVDVVIAGGADEFLANAGVSPVYPGDVVNPVRPYPLVRQDLNGEDVLVVTTTGEYRYVGRLVVEFDSNGDLVAVDPVSNPVCVLDQSIDAVNGVVADPACMASVISPINSYINNLATHVIAVSDVPLDGRRASVRTIETNEGDIFADAMLWEGQRRAAQYGVCAPNVAFQNGGGMRKDAIIPAGNITELNTYEIAAFDNTVVIVPNVPVSQFKEMLEAAVRLSPSQNGGFLQVGGFKFWYDNTRQAQVLDGNLNVTTPGERVRDVVLNDGTVLVRCGEVVPGAQDVCITTNNFTVSQNGDNIPFRGAPYTIIGVSYQQALYNYITDPAGLNGVISGAQYPSGAGQYRIVRNSATQSFTNFDQNSNFQIVPTGEAASELNNAYRVDFYAPHTPSSVTGVVSKTRPVISDIDYNLPTGWSINRFFWFTTSDNGSTGSTVALYFKACEAPAEVLIQVSNLAGIRTKDNGFTWNTISPSNVSLQPNGFYCVEFTGVDNVDGFWGLGISDRVLPVELTSFEAEVIRGEVALIWTTASETDVAHFELSRNSMKIAEISAHNNSTGATYSYTDRPEDGRNTYKLFEVSLNGETTVLGEVTVELSDGAVANEYKLGEAYPNPFNPQANIDFVIANAENVKLDVFNPLGQIVATLANGHFEAGSHTVQFDGANMTSGIYFYRLEAGSYSAMKKMVLVK